MSQNNPVAILNTSIATTYGKYEYIQINLDEARDLVRQPEGVLSAVGHESTAQILSTLLGMEVSVNRIFFQQQAGQEALVFKLRGRAPEGVILSTEEIEALGYDFGRLTRLS